jgi:hypothetical protein
VYQERKSQTRFDYADEEYAVNIEIAAGSPATGSPPSLSTGTLTLTDASDVEVGYMLEQGSTRSVVTAVTGSPPTQITLEDSDYEWTDGAATVYKPIMNTIEWLPQYAENPGIKKHWRECTFLFDDASFNSIDVTIKSNFYRGVTYELVPVESGLSTTAGGTWGGFPWGNGAWGVGTSLSERAGANLIRTLIPRQAARSHWLNIKLELEEPFATFSVEGVSIMFQPTSSRMR